VLAHGFFSFGIEKKNLQLPNIPIPMLSLNLPSLNQITSLLGKGGHGGHGGGGGRMHMPMMSGWGESHD
jgi:hypothetical protein